MISSFSQRMRLIASRPLYATFGGSGSSSLKPRHYSTSSPPRIAIVGGGPAGLTLGALLHKKCVPFTIFEFRSKPTESELEKPSGMLDLHQDSGLAAIQECGVHDEFLRLTGECSEEYKVADETGTPAFTHMGDRDRPEISRNNLYKLLLAKIPQESVQWNHKLQNCTPSSNGSPTIELDFGGAKKKEFDFVVGADGAWSRVRHILTDTRPNYTDVHVITATIMNISMKYPHLSELIGTGSFTALGNRQAVISQRGPQDSARLYLWIRSADEKLGATSGLSSKPSSEAKQTFLEDPAFLGSFGPSVKELVATALDEEGVTNPGSTLDIRPLYTLPHGSSWNNRAGATLVGDAAHLMLPNGEGVNQAMLDTMLLSKVIDKAYSTGGQNSSDFLKELNPLVKNFEVEMVQRAVQIGKETDKLFSMMFGSNDAAQKMKGFFQQMQEQHSNEAASA